MHVFVCTVKALYFAGIIFMVFPMNIISLEFNFTDFASVALLQCTANMFACYLILRKQFIREIHEINPMQILFFTVNHFENKLST